MLTHFTHVSIAKKAAIDVDGKCISYDLGFPGLARKSLGVILPAIVRFDAVSAETMEIVDGACKVRIGNDQEWMTLEAGQCLAVPESTTFDIEALAPVQYVRHYKNA